MFSTVIFDLLQVIDIDCRILKLNLPNCQVCTALHLERSSLPTLPASQLAALL